MSSLRSSSCHLHRNKNKHLISACHYYLCMTTPKNIQHETHVKIKWILCAFHTVYGLHCRLYNKPSKDVFSLFPGVRVYINIVMHMALRRLNQGWIYPRCLVMKTEPVSLMCFMSHNATGHLYSCISSLSDELVTACSYRGWPNSHTCAHTRFIVTMFMHKLSRTCPCMLMTAREWISAVYSPVPIVFRLH